MENLKESGSTVRLGLCLAMSFFTLLALAQLHTSGAHIWGLSGGAGEMAQ